MSADIIDGKAIAEEVRREVAAEVGEWVAAGNDPPGLATVLVGEDPASAVYIGGKQKATHEVGMRGFDHRLAADAPQADVEALLGDLNGDPRVSGILLQLPTPGHIDGAGLTWLIDPAKEDRKSTGLNSSHQIISYAVFCLKKKKKKGRWSSIPAARPTVRLRRGWRSGGRAHRRPRTPRLPLFFNLPATT